MIEIFLLEGSLPTVKIGSLKKLVRSKVSNKCIVKQANQVINCLDFFESSDHKLRFLARIVQNKHELTAKSPSENFWVNSPKIHEK